MGYDYLGPIAGLLVSHLGRIVWPQGAGLFGSHAAGFARLPWGRIVWSQGVKLFGSHEAGFARLHRAGSSGPKVQDYLGPMPQDLRVSHGAGSSGPKVLDFSSPMPQDLRVSHLAGSPAPRCRIIRVSCRRICSLPWGRSVWPPRCRPWSYPGAGFTGLLGHRISGAPRAKIARAPVPDLGERVLAPPDCTPPVGEGFWQMSGTMGSSPAHWCGRPSPNPASTDEVERAHVPTICRPPQSRCSLYFRWLPRLAPHDWHARSINRAGRFTDASFDLDDRSAPAIGARFRPLIRFFEANDQRHGVEHRPLVRPPKPPSGIRG